MRSQLQRIVLVLVTGAGLFLSGINASDNDTLRIGMAKSFFAGMPEVLANIAGKDLTDVMKKTTGIDGSLNASLSPLEIGQQVKDGKMDFAILHGHEYASLRKQFPDLLPMLIVCSKGGEHAYLVVRQDCDAKSVADLAGKKIDMPMDARQHCGVFFSKIGADNSDKDGHIFSSVTKSMLQVEALNDLARGKVDAVVIDTIGLAAFKELRGPVFEKNLKILVKSQAFPAPVIVYNRGGVDEKVVTQLREGLLKAHMTDSGKALMKDWKFERFASVPSDYEQNLDGTLKEFIVTQR